MINKNKNIQRKNYTIAVDFDGTLVENAYPEIGYPLSETVGTIKALQELGFIIILWTCRTGADLDAAVLKCKELGLEFDAVNSNPEHLINYYNNDPRKLGADVFVDDKSVGGLPSSSAIYSHVMIDYAKCINHGREAMITI